MRTGVIVAIVAGVLALGVVAFAVVQSRDNNGSTGASGSTDTGGLPPSIGGQPLLEGDVADAFKNLMDAYAGQGLAASGIYGSATRPEYMYLVLDTDIPPGLSGETFLRATAHVAGYPIKGGYVQGSDGDTHVTCAPYGSPGVSSMCFVAAGDTPAMAIGFHASADEALQDILETDI
jgi:hypothetical protein